MEHTGWDDLDTPVREAIERRSGTVHRARTATGGLNSRLALVLGTASGSVFIKGLPADHPGTVRLEREAVINPHVAPVTPRLLWHAAEAGWTLLAFEYIPGARHADYTPGSRDLPHVTEVMNRLQRIPCPDLPLEEATRRWAAYLDSEAAASLAGDTLLHTGFSPLSILMTPTATWIAGWTRPTRGAAFIDPASFLLRLIATGHSPASAEYWASQCISWMNAPRRGVDAFALASARLHEEIARQDPQPRKKQLARAARQWAIHRGILTLGSDACCSGCRQRDGCCRQKDVHRRSSPVRIDRRRTCSSRRASASACPFRSNAVVVDSSRIFRRTGYPSQARRSYP